MKYKFVDLKGYSGVEINDKVFLIDNGSPFSFGFYMGLEKPLFIHIDKYNYGEFNFQYSSHWNDDFMIENFGQCIDGLIGMDTLRKMGSIEINKADGTVVFGNILNNYDNSLKLDMHDTYPIIVNDNSVPCFFDIGAHMLTIKDKNIVAGLDVIGEINEGVYGGISLPFKKFNVNVTINSESFNTDSILIPSSISSHYPNYCFMSISCISKESFAYDFKNRIIKYK